MPQQTSPFIEGKYGWSLGESGWNSGMDENLIKFSYMFDRNIDGIVSTLPSPVINGRAYYLTTDKRVYYSAGGFFYSVPLPNKFQIFNKQDQKFYIFDTTSGTLQEDTTQQDIGTLETKVSSLESDVNSLETTLASPGDLTFKSFTTGIEKTLKSRFVEVFDLSEFADLTVSGGLNQALVKAQTLMTRPSKIIIPPGFFEITSPLLTRADIPLIIEGAGTYSTVISASSSLNGLPMMQADGPLVGNHYMSGFTLLGNGFAALGYQCENLVHSSFYDVQVQGTTLAAIRTNNGYNVYFEKLEIFLNSGHGLDITGANNNNVNLNDCAIYGNDGTGVRLSDGWGIVLNGCCIEANKQAGLMCWSLRGLKINGGYFERNAGVGYTYSPADGSPETLTVKADIHLLSGGRTIGYLDNFSVLGCLIQGVSFTPFGSGNFPTSGLSQDCIVFATDLDGVAITNNDILDTAHVTSMLGIFDDNRRSRCKSLRMEQNTLNNITRLGTAANEFTFSTAHNVENAFEKLAFQYAPQTISSYTVAGGTTGALTTHTSKYGTVQAWQASVGDHLYGFSIDLTANPELLGKHVWFGVAYRVLENNTGVQVFCGGRSDNAGAGTENVTPAGEWKFKSVLRYIGPSETSLFIGFKRIGAGTQPILIAAPSVGIFGVSLAKLNGKRS